MRSHITNQLTEPLSTPNKPSFAGAKLFNKLPEDLKSCNPKTLKRQLHDWLVKSPSALCLYLVKDLPLSLWRPKDSDLTILEHWLLQSGITSVRHALARHIISSLNLGYATDDLSHELFLSRAVHVRIAMMVLKTAVQYCPQSPPEGNTISDTVKQVDTTSVCSHYLETYN
ncbi:Ectopic P granules protein 5 [Homalodisca vitripennis]|nr:Ectopic P granules protein 5 [Homalodisca vitripennis]